MESDQRRARQLCHPADIHGFLARDARQRRRIRTHPTLRGPAAQGAQYILIYPCTVIGADLDCVWFKQMAPDGPGMVRYSAGFCFPKVTVERPDFEQIVPNYHKRFDLVISEDNGIAEMQLQGLSNPLSRSGRFSAMEPLVHTIDNWILDRVIGPLSDRAANGSRVSQRSLPSKRRCRDLAV